MEAQVTIQIPQTVYRKAERLAHRRHQSIDSVLDEAIALAEAAFVQQSQEVQNQEAQQMEREEAAYTALLDELLANHLHEYVAIHQGKLVDCDRSQRELLIRLNRNYPDDIVLMRQVRAEPEPDLHFRSPRFE